MRDSAARRIVELASAGMRPSLIAVLVSRQPATVYHYLAAARKAGAPIPKFKTGSGWNRQRFLVAVDPSMKGDLADAAARRGIDPRELAALILTTVVQGGLIDAVLDDREAGDA
jgi:hypothetical protein